MNTQTHNRPDFGIPLSRHAAPQSVGGQGHRFLITHVAATAACATELLVDIDKRLGGGYGAVLIVALAFVVLTLGTRSDDRQAKTNLDAFLRAGLALVLLLRIGLPLALTGADAGYTTFLAPRYDEAYVTLSDIKHKTQSVYEAAIAAKDHSEQSWLRRMVETASDKWDALNAASMVLAENFDHFFESVFTMAAILGLRIFGFPLLLGWAMWRFVQRLTQPAA